MAGAFLRFTTAPSPWALYPRILVAQKPGLVREGADVPRLEATLSPVRIDRAALAAYRGLIAAPLAEELPLAYPHVLASPLHLALLSSPLFPVKLLGLVHVANRIEQRAPLPIDGGGEIVTWIEGFSETARGQEFVLHTEWRVAGECVWFEHCTFLARRRRKPPGRGDQPRVGGASAGPSGAAPAGATPTGAAPTGAAIHTSSFRADAGLGRSYGWVSGDINPIHLFDVTARLFGFPAAIAHGMWSMARCAAEFAAQRDAMGRCALEVDFRQPVLLPSWLLLESWNGTAGARDFALRDAQGDKIHLSGSLQPLR